MTAAIANTQLPPLAESYLRSTNRHDAAGFQALFAEHARVKDAGREFRGIQAIKEWSKRDIFDASVTLELLRAELCDGGAVLTTKVDGNFDRTGLPDPVVISHRLQIAGDKIVELSCALAEAPGS